MIRNTKVICSLHIIRNLILFLSIFSLKSNAEIKIIAKSGDTLIKISRQYSIPLKELMHKNNFNDGNKILEGEVIVIPISNTINDAVNNFQYKVLEGDTLYGIARKYQIDLEDIISLNNLNDNSFLKSNQIILLPKEATLKKEINQSNLKIATKKVFYHQSVKGEKLSEIAKIHNVSTEEIISLNKIKNPTEFNSSSQLKIRIPKPPKWLKYGSLMLNWTSWRYLDGYYVVQAKNKNKKSFFIALNCEKRILNNTIENNYWTNWDFPKYNFEYKIINDFCKN